MNGLNGFIKRSKKAAITRLKYNLILKMATIIVGAYMVRYPLGGMMSWVFQHLAGLKALGHKVYFVEKSGYSNSCFNPATRSSGNDCSYGIRMVNDLLSTVNLQNNWCFVDHEGNYYGISQNKIESVF